MKTVSYSSNYRSYNVPYNVQKTVNFTTDYPSYWNTSNANTLIYIIVYRNDYNNNICKSN